MRPIQKLLPILALLYMGNALAQYYYYYTYTYPRSSSTGSSSSSNTTSAAAKKSEAEQLEAASARRQDASGSPGNIFCCDDANGRKVCGDFLPEACQARAYEVRDSKGFVSRRVEAPLTPEQQARRQAEVARKAEEKKKALEEARRTQALLATYANENDIDRARDRELAEADKAIEQAQKRLDDAMQKTKKLDKEMEFYKGKTVPAQVKVQVRDNAAQIQAQKDAIESQNKAKEDIRAKYEDEKRRFLELTGKKPAAAKPAAAAAEAEKPAAPAVAAVPTAAPAKP